MLLLKFILISQETPRIHFLPISESARCPKELFKSLDHSLLSKPSICYFSYLAHKSRFVILKILRSSQDFNFSVSCLQLTDIILLEMLLVAFCFLELATGRLMSGNLRGARNGNYVSGEIPTLICNSDGGVEFLQYPQVFAIGLPFVREIVDQQSVQEMWRTCETSRGCWT